MLEPSTLNSVCGSHPRVQREKLGASRPLAGGERRRDRGWGGPLDRGVRRGPLRILPGCHRVAAQ
eukprot:6146674-Alexandrium_andersonii.AAC.1